MEAKVLASSPSGRYSAGGVSSTSTRAPPVTVAAMVARRRGAVALSQWEKPCTRRNQPLSWPSWSNTAPKSSRAARVGITVIATSMEIRIDADTAMAMSE